MASRQDVQKRRVWEVRLERFQASGLTVSRFCEREGVPVHSFYYWSRRVKTSLGKKSSSAPREAAKRRRYSEPTPPAAAPTSAAAMVRFHLSGAVDVSVPAECLDAIRCLAECLHHARRDRSDAFHEVVVTS